ncbi:MAG: hypothetical protein ABH821_03050 [archaeon]
MDGLTITNLKKLDELKQENVKVACGKGLEKLNKVCGREGWLKVTLKAHKTQGQDERKRIKHTVSMQYGCPDFTVITKKTDSSALTATEKSVDTLKNELKKGKDRTRRNKNRMKSRLEKRRLLKGI